MSILTLDIETFAGEEPKFIFDKDSLIIPKTYKGTPKEGDWIIKQEADAKEKHNKDYRKQAVVSHKAQLLCIGYAINNDDPDVLLGSEEEIMVSFEKLISSLHGGGYEYMIVGHNIKSFDLKFLYHRACRYSLSALYRWFPSSRYSDRIKDTMELFSYLDRTEFISLDTISRYFGLEGKGSINGASVHDMYLKGKIKEIGEYCKDDVRLTRDVYKKLSDG